jgi:hypothetical protein
MELVIAPQQFDLPPTWIARVWLVLLMLVERTTSFTGERHS